MSTTFVHLSEESANISVNSVPEKEGMHFLTICTSTDKVFITMSRKQLESMLFAVDSHHSSLVYAEQELDDYYESIVLDQQLEDLKLGL